MLPIWLYVVVAFAMAACAFALGHIVPGLGMIFVAFGSTLWVAWSVRASVRASRQRSCSRQG